LDNPISWDYLSTVPGPNEVFGPLAILYLIVFVAGFVVTLLIYNNQGKQLFPNPVAYRLVRRWAGWALVVFGAGIFFFLIRALQINPFTFAMRFWMWVTVLALGALVILTMIDFRRHYKEQMANYNARKQREEYMKPLQAAGGSKRATSAALATSPRPIKKKRR
jgi:phosphoglycerol transferase MdoB-like AlkP superfamily enzyme